ncbi:MAG: DNA-binding protein [Anaeromicrobium sp.]|uniref:DNA-binding protein n=1 Tax=Anaeromicrobium sp. TaxID=1929132 RepID=UPI0025DC62BA|nr:DNA-binding protein [Anaeromicrobium sp.]MCT4593199.1 DNA-binding protein [Anaeromicrobium sp.]
MKDIKEVLGKLSIEELTQLIKDEILTSKEVQEELGITQQRLSSMNKPGKLQPIKKGIYLKREVLLRKEEQANLRQKYLHTEEYKK